MRELSVRIKFITPSLGNEKNHKSGHFCFQRGPSPSSKILFLATWQHSNMKLAAEMMGRHQEASKNICWDIEIDATLREKCYTRCYYQKAIGGRQRWSLHESLMPGQTATINCVVPSEIDDQDFWSLMQIAGKYKGLSAWQPGKYGHYEVISIQARRRQPFPDTDE